MTKGELLVLNLDLRLWSKYVPFFSTVVNFLIVGGRSSLSELLCNLHGSYFIYFFVNALFFVTFDIDGCFMKIFEMK
jgi:hypothetical protein